MSSTVESTAPPPLPFPRRSGKVRDVYDLEPVVPGHLLIVASDRISAFDVIMPTPIPGKGKILTSLATFWFKHFKDVSHHLVETDVRRFPVALKPFAGALAGRSSLVRKTVVIPIECVARGYLAGSGWVEYQKTGTVCGVPLPAGLNHCDRLPLPIFTPATKADVGHDENISFERACQVIGGPLAGQLRDLTLRIYSQAAAFALPRGIIIADTKFEFGLLPNGDVLLIDEILTPDSSRFWPAADYAPGRDQPSFDKQFLRNWLLEQPWDRTPPGPTLPKEVVAGTLARYQEAHQKITGAICPL